MVCLAPAEESQKSTLTSNVCKTTCVVRSELQGAGSTRRCDKKQPSFAHAVVALENKHLYLCRQLCQKIPMLTQILSSSCANLQVQLIWIIPSPSTPVSVQPKVSVSAQPCLQAKSRCSKLAQKLAGPFQKKDLISLCWSNT